LGGNRSRNATVKVLADGYTDTLTDANQFIIGPMLYAIAMGQIKSVVTVPLELRVQIS